MKLLHTKKFRYGSVSIALTVVIIAAVILLNAVFTALSEKFTWYVDMTAEEIYTLSDEAKELLDTVDKGRNVTVIFCMPKDELEAEQTLRYPLYTVLEMVQAYENISVKYVDCLTNPSAVAQYKESSGQAINGYSIIVTSTFSAADPVTNEVKDRTQSRVYALSSLYTYDGTGKEIIGYNGEQRLVSAVLAVTQVEVPLACYTYGHGEADDAAALSKISPLTTLLYETGYEVRAIDLKKDNIPDNCRLLVIFNPKNDFAGPNDLGGVNEIAKLEKFLDGSSALMTFFNHETPVMENLEALLKEWGVEICRETVGDTSSNYLVKDAGQSFDPDGIINVAEYAESGLGASVTRQLREANYRKPAVFKYATALKYSSTYETIYDDDNKCFYGAYYSNGISRDCYDVFTSSPKAIAEAHGSKVAEGPFKYMTVTRESQTDATTGKTVYSYVMACASTEFVSGDALASSYANHTVLTRACHAIGGAQVSVSLNCKYFSDMEIDSITAADANQYTIVLTVVPAALIFIAGVYIMVRRKYA